MTYKRQVNRLPIIPADAKEHNVTCHYCIVGCGYKAYTWPINKQGTATSNKFGVDLSQQQEMESPNWYAPSMYNVVRQDGKDVHLVVMPDHDCVVNSGLGSIRGARMAENRPSKVTGTQQQRLSDPLIWRSGTMQPTSWDDALDLVARVTARVITQGSEDDLVVSMFDHGGSAGGYENTWATGKLYFESMKVKNCRIHNRPAYNSEVHSTRDMGVDELNYAYKDYEMTDTIMVVGANPLETQTNLFLNHMVPGMRNGARFIMVDPRRSVTLNAAEQVIGAENVLHLAIKPGTDLALFNALFTEIVDKGWTDKDFIANSTLAVGRPAAYVDQLLINGGGKVHHIWANDHYKTTLNAAKFKRAHKRRADMVKDAMDASASGTREQQVEAIVAAINAGGLFVVDVDIIRSKIGESAHVLLPAVEANEMNLTSMNGERRLRLSEKYMDPFGNSKPDCLIAAGIAQNMERVLREMGNNDYADKFKGYDWKTEEDAFMDGYNKGNPEVTYERLRAMGNNGVQEPVTGFKDGKLVGTERLYTDGKFTRHGREDGKALFCASTWRGWQAAGKEAEMAKFKYWINNGRANIFWQNQFLDQASDFIQDRYPFPFIEMNPEDMAELGVGAGALVEIYNDNGATQGMVYPTKTARRGEVMMLFGSPAGSQGNVINAGVNELVLPDYKHSWGNIRKISDAPATVKGTSFKSKEYKA